MQHLYIPITLLFLLSYSVVQSQYSGNPRLQNLASAISLEYTKPVAHQKKEAGMFLLRHLESHRSYSYIWKDSCDARVPFEELSFTNYPTALRAFAHLKDSLPIRPQPVSYSDADTIRSDDMLINIDLAFSQWQTRPWSSTYSEEVFYEYILPYRSVGEPLQDWRKDYLWYFREVPERVGNTRDPVAVMAEVMSYVPRFDYVSSRKEPLPLLGPKQLIFREQGACPDLANLMVFAGRALGVAVTYDFTPHWAASSNRHMWNTVVDRSGTHIPFDSYRFYNPAEHRRLGKAFRFTYSTQPQSLAAQVPFDSIPPGFLRNSHLLDVTSEYQPTASLEYTLPASKSKVAYLNVFNTGSWRVTDWGKAVPGKPGTYSFSNLGTALVYLPSVYHNGGMQWASYPVRIQKDGRTQLLKPSATQRCRPVFSRANEVQTSYEDHNPQEFLEGESYTLYYWEGDWKMHQSTTARNASLAFTEVPIGGLYRLEPKGRPDHWARVFTFDPETYEISWY